MDYSYLDKTMDNLFPGIFRPFTYELFKSENFSSANSILNIDHLICFYIPSDYTSEQLNIYLSATKEYLSIPGEADKERFMRSFLTKYNNRTEIENWQKRQAYIAIGTILSVLNGHQKNYISLSVADTNLQLLKSRTGYELIEIILINNF